MNRVFIDVNIPMYAAGAVHPLKEPCQQIVRAIAGGQPDAYTDVEVFQEILYRFYHIKQKEKGLKIFDLFRRIMSGRILPVDDLDLQKTRELTEDYTELSPRDLIHLAVMLRHDLEAIISADKGFDVVQGIMRVNPGNSSSLPKTYQTKVPKVAKCKGLKA